MKTLADELKKFRRLTKQRTYKCYRGLKDPAENDWKKGPVKPK